MNKETRKKRKRKKTNKKARATFMEGATKRGPKKATPLSSSKVTKGSKSGMNKKVILFLFPILLSSFPFRLRLSYVFQP